MAISKISGSGLGTINSPVEFTSADNLTQLTLTSTDADATTGPVLDLVRDSGSPADGDSIGQIKFTADNDAGEATIYSNINNTLRDASNGAEDGQFQVNVITNGASVDHLRMGRGSANGQSEVVFNEGSADIDFRVESNGNANALVVDGGTDTVMIGTTDTNFNAGADNLIVGTGSGDCGITIYTGSSVGHKGSIFFGDTAAGDAANSQKGQISYEQNNEIMTFFTNNTLTMQMNHLGSVSIPRQPAFQVKGSSVQSNIAADNSFVAVAFGTEIFDLGGNFASNTFTAPVTGKYQMQVNVQLGNVDSASQYYFIRLATSNRNYDSILSVNQFNGDLSHLTLHLQILADMDVSDTALVQIVQQSGTSQTDIDALSNFSGFLVA